MKANQKSKQKEMPEPPCCRIVKFKETESTCSSIHLTAILDPRSSNTKSAALNDLNSTCQEQNMQEVAKKRSGKKTERNLRKEMENRRTLRRKNEQRRGNLDKALDASWQRRKASEPDTHTHAHTHQHSRENCERC